VRSTVVQLPNHPIIQLPKSAWLKLATILAAIWAAAGPLPSDLVERVYAQSFYPRLQPRLTTFSNMTIVPLLDVGAIALLAGLAIRWFVGVRHAGRDRTRVVRTIGLLVIDTAAVAAIVYLWFAVAWGMNYRRPPLRNTLDFQEERVTRDALRELAMRTIAELNALYPAAWRETWPGLREMPAFLRPGFTRAQHQLGIGWEVMPALPKRSLLNVYFTRAAVDGMTNPFFLETLVNQSLLPFERPFVVAHEWAHLAGYADESEANFMAWLTCMQGDARTRYSAWLSLYGTVLSAVPGMERTEIVMSLQTGPRRDLRATVERVERQSSPAARRAGEAVYDRFLKANRVEAGIASYGEVLRLLLGTRFTDEGAPVLRGRS
jgi:hypothetical protein